MSDIAREHGDEVPMPRRHERPPVSNARAFGITLSAVAAVALALLVWQLVFVLLVAFGGVLLAVLLRHCAIALARRTPLSTGLAIALVILVLFSAASIFLVTQGPRMAAQFAKLAQSLPAALDAVESALSQSAWGSYLLDHSPNVNGVSGVVGAVEDDSRWSLLGGIGGTISTLTGVLANLVIALVVGIFLALDPGLYRGGFVGLLRPERRERATEVLNEIGRNLWRWELGQFVDMAAVALAIGLGLWAIGVPLPVALGLIAGLTNFVPYIGPILGGVPAVLIAFTQGPEAALWTVALFVVVQQLEGHVLMPMIQKRATALPPVLTVLVVVGASVPFGLLGVLLATPMFVVVMVLVRTLWMEDALGGR